MPEEHQESLRKPRRARRPRRLARVLLCLGGLAAAGLIFGFLLFSALATAEPPARSVEADAIVVLTGGGHRLRVAGELLRRERARYLLISGVNRIVSRRKLSRLTGIDDDLFKCCVTIGYQAQNTRGNAKETRAWTRKHQFKSLIVVTASYHMARSLVELGRVLPDVDLIPTPVLPARFRVRPWWFDGRDTRLLAAEYLKFLPAALHYGIDRMIETPAGGAEPSNQKAVAVQ